MDKFTLTVPSKICYLNAAAFFFKECLLQSEKIKNDEQLIYNLDLVLSEALTNAVKHPQCSDENPYFILEIMISDIEIEISVIDFGHGFDIIDVREPDFEAFQEGGYGIFVMRSMMDFVDYKIDETSGNRLILKKSLLS